MWHVGYLAWQCSWLAGFDLAVFDWLCSLSLLFYSYCLNEPPTTCNAAVWLFCRSPGRLCGVQLHAIGNEASCVTLWLLDAVTVQLSSLLAVTCCRRFAAAAMLITDFSVVGQCSCLAACQWLASCRAILGLLRAVGCLVGYSVLLAVLPCLTQ